MCSFLSTGTNYTIRTYTGNAPDAGTTANIYLTLFGDKGDSGFRMLSRGEKKYQKGRLAIAKASNIFCECRGYFNPLPSFSVHQSKIIWQ